jgi:tetratricopeptide (TPR) repeat protein
MKKVLLSFLMLGAMTTVSLAQDDPAASLKAAKKNIQRYRDDPKDTKALEDARASIDAALKTDALLNDPKTAIKTLMTKADVYSELANADNTAAFLAQSTKQTFTPKYGDAAVQAVETYVKVLNTATASKSEKRDALEYLKQPVVCATNNGLIAFNAKKYADAYRAFMSAVAAKKATNGAKETSILDKPGEVEETKFNAALCAINAKMSNEAIALLEELRAVNYIQLDPKNNTPMNPAQIHKFLVDLYMKDGKKDKALATISEGKTKYPDDVDLGLSEINYYIGEGQLDKLEDKLEAAIKKDPKNVGLYTVKAKMYESLGEKYAKDGKTEDAAKAIEGAKLNYTRALEQDPKSFDALYGLGAIPFNKAAKISAEMKNLGMSKADQKRYDEIVAQMKVLFTEALPFFERADAVNDKDNGVVIALLKINETLGNSDKAKLYKQRLSK